MRLAYTFGANACTSTHYRSSVCRFFQSRQLLKDTATTVVEQQDGKVVAQIAVPQGVLVVEKAQVAYNAEHTFVFVCRCHTYCSGERSLYSVHPTVYENVVGRAEIAQLFP